MYTISRIVNPGICGLIILWITPAHGFVTPLPAGTKPTYSVNANARGCAIEVRVNDIPVLRIDSEDHNRPPRGAASAGLWLINGVNELRLVVLRTYTGSGTPDARAWISTENGPDGLLTESPQASDPGVIMLAEWAPPAGNITAPKPIDIHKDLGQTAGDNLWAKAPRLTLDDQTRKKVGDFLASVRKALMKGDGNAMVTYQEPQIRDAASSSGMLVKDLQNMTREMARGWMKQHGPLAPLNPPEWDFRIAADGRLIECLNKDGRPTLRTAAPDPLGLQGYGIFVGLDRGQMKIFLRG
jgi:hypothetical protein